MTDLSFPTDQPPPRRRKALWIVLLLLGLCSLVTLLPLAAYLVLSRVTRTYTDAQLGFSVPYPALWSYRAERWGSNSYRVVFTPSLDPLAREQQLTVTVSKDAAYARLSHNQCLMSLKAQVAELPSGQVLELGRRTVAGWEGAVVGITASDPNSVAWDGWWAMLSTNDGVLWLDFLGPKGSLDKLRPPFERLLAGLTLTQQGQADDPAEELATCAEGFYPYRAACAGLGFCYPASWLVDEAGAEARSGVCTLLIGPSEWNYISSGVIILTGGPTAAGDRGAPDERLLSDLRRLAADDHGTVTVEPALTQLTGRRAAVITWQAEVLHDGVTTTVDKRVARILDDEWDVLIAAAGPLTARQLLLIEFDRLVASLVLRSPTEAFRP